MLVRSELQPGGTVANQSGRMTSLRAAVADITGRVCVILYDETAHPVSLRRPNRRSNASTCASHSFFRVIETAHLALHSGREPPRRRDTHTTGPSAPRFDWTKTQCNPHHPVE